MPEKIDTIERVEDLPEWFDLSKYDGILDFNAQDWASALDVRLFISGASKRESAGVLKAYNNIYSQKAADPLKVLEDHRKSLLKALTKSPLSTTNKNIEVKRTDEFNSRFSSVSGLKVWDIVCLSEGLRENPATRKYFDASLKFVDDLDPNSEFKELATTEYYLATRESFPLEDSEAFLSLDLLATDKQIFSDLKNWLKTIRLELNAASLSIGFNEKQLKRWCEHKLLAYIDLTLWSDLEKCKIPQHVYGEALFGTGATFDTTEKIRKTLQPLAQKLLSRRAITGLLLHPPSPKR
jgi:hypothetical protein